MNDNRYGIAVVILLISFSVSAGVDNMNPLVVAVKKSQCEEVKKLLAVGAVPDSKFTERQTKQSMPVIYMAIHNSDICTLDLLITYGADVNNVFKIYSGDDLWFRERTPLTTAIHGAYRSKNSDIVYKLLSHGARADLKASDGLTHVQHTLNYLDKSMVYDFEMLEVAMKIERMLEKHKNY